jgi:hypothetical protein
VIDVHDIVRDPLHEPLEVAASGALGEPAKDLFGRAVAEHLPTTAELGVAGEHQLAILGLVTLEPARQAVLEAAARLADSLYWYVASVYGEQPCGKRFVTSTVPVEHMLGAQRKAARSGN